MLQLAALLLVFAVPFFVLAGASKTKYKLNSGKASVSISEKNAKTGNKKAKQINKKKKSPRQDCVNNPNPVFTADITDMSRISKITPPGMLMNGNMFKSHSYLWIADGGKVPLYAPADAQLIGGAHYSEQGINQYTLLFRVSCEVEFILDHFLEPIETIRSAFPATPKIEDTRTDFVAPVFFKAGDLLGYTSGTPAAHNWDFGVYNSAKPDPDAAAYDGATDKDRRANCPYDYFAPEKQNTYRTLFSPEIGNGVMRVTYCD